MMQFKFIVPTVIGACAIMTLSSEVALAFHPFDDTYGYQMPNWSDRKAKRAAPQVAAEPKQKPQRSAKVLPAAAASSDDDDPKPTGRKAKAEQQAPNPSTKMPPKLEGGARPAISATAPPVVPFSGGYGVGTVVIDTSARTLYYTLSATTAYKYPISVGREGFTWTGTQQISQVVSWPDWRPPAEMKERQPNLPDVMTGGIRNPLGAKALYLGNSLYRIHGTNDVSTIGQAASSGCFRMTNGHVMHLASVAGVGTTVRVLNRVPNAIAEKSTNRKRG
jgi:lipoprotein-anchoring transpeptidase ErfK/SrfK